MSFFRVGKSIALGVLYRIGEPVVLSHFPATKLVYYAEQTITMGCLQIKTKILR